MRIEPIPVRLQMPPGLPRSEGLHQSKIIRRMAAERGILKDIDPSDLSLVETDGEGFWEKLDMDSQTRMALGLAWEQWYVPTQLEDVNYQPGELQLDGIYMTPDGESLDFIYSDHSQIYIPTCHEIKVTSKSTNTVEGLQGDKNWLWRAQLMGFCKAMNTNIAYLHALFLYGDYSRPFRMQARCWRVEFSWFEINRHWDAITSYVRYMTSLEREEEMRD